MTAPVGEVMTPIVSGRYGSARLRVSANSPFGREHRFASFELREQRADARGFEPVDDQLIFAPLAVRRQLARRDHLEPIFGPEAEPRGAQFPDTEIECRARILQARIDMARGGPLHAR